MGILPVQPCTHTYTFLGPSLQRSLSKSQTPIPRLDLTKSSECRRSKFWEEFGREGIRFEGFLSRVVNQLRRERKLKISPDLNNVGRWLLTMLQL